MRGDLMARLYKIFGRVQGVGFRNYAYRVAMTVGISGYVRNLYDGTVEVLADSIEEAKVFEFERKLQRGPSFARVDELRLVESEIECDYTDFFVK
jgi:acylphosphatase